MTANRLLTTSNGSRSLVTRWVHSVPFPSANQPVDDLKPKIQHTKDDVSLKESIRELRTSVMGTDTRIPSDV